VFGNVFGDVALGGMAVEGTGFEGRGAYTR
jgi:hypothetical protein